MPQRNIEGQYPYAYQGQEKDAETGMEAFELRLWDSRIGRWLTTDPYGQYASPYLGMGNNPISRIDPDGGEDDTIYKHGDQTVEVDDGVNRTVEVNAELFEIAQQFASLGTLNIQNWTHEQFLDYSQFHNDALYGSTFGDRLLNLGNYAFDGIWEGYWENTLQDPFITVAVVNSDLPVGPGGGKSLLKGTKWIAKMLRKPNAIAGSETITTLKNGFQRFSVSIKGRNGSYTTYSKFLNSDGKTVKWFHDTFDKTHRFVHREFNHAQGRLKIWWNGVREIINK